MVAKTKVKDIDRGWKTLVTKIGKLDRAFVQVGLQAGDKGEKRVKRKGQPDQIVESDEDIALIAAVNEFGSGPIPSRPFMRQTFDKNERELSARVGAEFSAVVSGSKTPQQSLEQLGLWYTYKMQAEVASGDFAPNSPVTIAIKGSSRPLIDTGRMRQSIRHVVKIR